MIKKNNSDPAITVTYGLLPAKQNRFELIMAHTVQGEWKKAGMDLYGNELIPIQVDPEVVLKHRIEYQIGNITMMENSLEFGGRLNLLHPKSLHLIA